MAARALSGPHRRRVGPFVPGPRAHFAGNPSGPLGGLTFAVKDLFDVAGYRTGGGNPDWARSRPAAIRHAAAVQALLDAGASLVGKTVTDEVSLGILGENAFYGTPVNPRARDRVPGGSSSGSAVAVAAGQCDAALGTDTGGSVRVPASFCGVFGIRPTHGRLDLRGMLPQAPSSDTAGWFARDSETLARVSEALLGEALPRELPGRLIIATDAFGAADPTTSDALDGLVRRVSAVIGTTRTDVLTPQGLATWARAQSFIQRSEAWNTFQAWVDRDNPRLAFSVARALIDGSATVETDLRWAHNVRVAARVRMRELVPHGAVLALPTTPFPALHRGLSVSALDPLRERIRALCCVGGLTGHPQISIPGSSVDGLPVGLSLIGAHGEDGALVAVARALADAGGR